MLKWVRVQFQVLRGKGTERPGTGEYDKHYEEGVYACAGCGTPLYKSATKFKVRFADPWDVVREILPPSP